MRYLILALLIAFPVILPAQKNQRLKKVMELKMPKNKQDVNSGSNGSSVAYNPASNKFYASYAGNRSFPLAVFNANGKRISNDELKGRVDMRGMWYNRKLKTICGKVHGERAWFSYELSNNGIPISKEIYVKTRIKSTDQNIAAYNTKKNLVYLLDGAYIRVYNANGQENEEDRLRIYPGINDKNDIDDTNNGRSLSNAYNENVLVYTGQRKAEFGILNRSKKQIELYNKKNGLLTKVLELPRNTRVYGAFNFSYADGLFWLYNKSTRTWIGFE